MQKSYGIYRVQTTTDIKFTEGESTTSIKGKRGTIAGEVKEIENVEFSFRFGNSMEV
jgi:hypothetical protein